MYVNNSDDKSSRVAAIERFLRKPTALRWEPTAAPWAFGHNTGLEKRANSSWSMTLATTAIFAIAAIWFSSVCFGADPDAADGTDGSLATVATSTVPDAGTEKFVPNITPIACSGTLELLKTAEITGKVIRVRQVVRWSEADSESFVSIADLIIDRYDGTDNRKLTMDELRNTLKGAGVNLGMVRFAGASTCLISHSDKPEPAAPKDDHEVVQQWMEKNSKSAPQAEVAASNLSPNAADDQTGQFHSLRDLLLIDVSQRLNVPVDALQMTFDPKDRTVLNLSEPAFTFELQPRRVRDLGRVSWDVTIASGDKQHTVTINAEARAWERQYTVDRAAAYKQVLRDADVSEHRVLVDHMPEDALLKREQIVGQQAARDLKPGTLLTAKLVDPVPLAHNGDYITVTLNKGSLQIRSIARAMEAGSFGQTIKVQNEQTKDVFEVTLTGPQTATVGAAQSINAE